MNKPNNGRIRWVDCARAVAMMAVVMDHCHFVLYNSNIAVMFTYFSVGLFVLVSGISAQLVFESKGRGTGPVEFYVTDPLKRLLKLFAQYAVANLLIILFFDRKLVPAEYFRYLFTFTLEGPFYFFLFFFQLILVTPELLMLCSCLNAKKNSAMWQTGAVLLLTAVGVLCTKYTFIVDTFGAGKHVLGGTFLALYYLGMVLKSRNAFPKSAGYKAAMLPIALAAWFFLQFFARKIDRVFSPVFGIGQNPPGIALMGAALASLYICCIVFSFLEKRDGRKWADIILKAFEFVGKNTVYIFLYHQSLIRLISESGDHTEAGIPVQLFWYLVILLVPAAAGAAVKKLKRRIRKRT